MPSLCCLFILSILLSIYSVYPFTIPSLTYHLSSLPIHPPCRSSLSLPLPTQCNAASTAALSVPLSIVYFSLPLHRETAGCARRHHAFERKRDTPSIPSECPLNVLGFVSHVFHISTPHPPIPFQHCHHSTTVVNLCRCRQPYRRMSGGLLLRMNDDVERASGWDEEDCNYMLRELGKTCHTPFSAPQITPLA